MKKLIMAVVLTPMMALATTWYVDGSAGADSYSGTSSSAAKKTIQAAIDASAAGDTILVAPGTYAPITTDNKAITIRSINGMASTIIDGENSSRCALLGTSTNECSTVLEGFTIRNGYLYISWTGSGGAGVRGGTLVGCTVTNCCVDGSWSGYGGEGGGVADAHVRKCIIEECKALAGGGLSYCIADACTIRNCYARDDSGGAHWSVLSNCLLTGNYGYNVGGGGCGSAMAGCNAVNCTIADNEARSGGTIIGGVLCNCIIYNNTPINLAGGYNSYETEHDGEPIFNSCFTDAPSFVDENNGDYRLAAGSPCIDAGDNSYVTTTTDLAGNARIANGTVDIGCYEYGSSSGVNITDGLVAYWPFDGNFDNVAAGGPSLVNSGVSTTTDRFGVSGRAAYFNGAARLTSNEPWYVSDSFTLSCWIRPETSGGAVHSEGTGGTYYSGSYALFPMHGHSVSSSLVGVGFAAGTDGITVYEHAGCYVPTPLVYRHDIGTSWTHVAIRVSNSSAPELYVNGQLVRTGLSTSKQKILGFSTDTNISPGERGGIGAGAFYPYTYFTGAMDEIRIYNRALSAAEVKALYDGTGVMPTMVPGFYRVQISCSDFDSTTSIWNSPNKSVTLYPSELYATECPEYTMYAFASYMWMKGGVTYNFRAGYDDRSTVVVNGETVCVLEGKWGYFGYDCQENEGCYTPTVSGWYPIELRAWNRAGEGGATTDEYHLISGFWYNSSEDSNWRKFEDLGDGARFRAIVGDSTSVKSFTVTFDMNGADGVAPAKRYVAEGSAVGTLPVVTREGYEFLGWHVGKEASSATVTASTVVTGDVIWYAVWKVAEYTVAFNLNGASGTAPAKRSVTHGASAGTLPTVSRTGYTFLGWFTAANGGSQISSSTKVTASATYYAHWQAITYTVMFDMNGADGAAPASRSLTYGSTIGALPTPSRTGYTFLGWFTAKSGGSQISASTTVTASVVYYAQWQINTYTVTFNLNGADGSAPAGRNKTYGTAIGTLPTVSRTGHTFLGWFTAANGGTQVYATDAVTASRTLYAHWQAITYTVTFNANGGQVAGGGESRQRDYGTTVGALPSASRSGYVFKGWFTSASGGSQVTSATVVTGNATYYARWATHGEEIAAALGASGVEITTDSNAPWFPEGAAARSGGISHNGSSTMILRLYGAGLLSFRWKVSSEPGYDTLSYSVDGIQGGQISGEQNWTAASILVSGAGWHTVRFTYAKDGGSTYGSDCGWVDSLVWTGGAAPTESFTVTLNPNGGTCGTASVKRNKDTSLGTLPTPTRTGYTFTGWFTAVSGGTQASSSTKVTKDVTYYAHWTATSHTPPSWTPVAKEDTMVIFATILDVASGKRIEADGTRLAAFDMNGECRGVATVMSGPSGRLFQLSAGIEGATERGFVLKAWNPATGKTSVVAERVACNSARQIGTISAPREFKAGYPEIAVNINKGWNWISTCLDAGELRVGEALAECKFANNDVVKSATGSATYFGGAWYPADFRIEPGVAYAVKKGTGGAESVTFRGPAMGGKLAVKAGWNWIGATATSAVKITGVAHSTGFANDDMVKSVGDSTTYYGGKWYPATFELKPGAGYKAKFAKAGSLSFSGTAKTAAQVRDEPVAAAEVKAAADVQSAKPDWTPVVQEDTMIAYIQVQDASGKKLDADGSVLAAFSASGECRGVTEIMDGPGGKVYQLSIGVTSATESGFTLKLWDAGTKKARDVSGTIACNAEKQIGSIDAPVVKTVAAGVLTYLVTFDARSGETAEPLRSVKKNAKIGKLPTAKRTGYKFAGWYTKASGGTKVATSAKVTKNVTYYAHWTAIKYTIKFDKNGGKGTMKAQSATYGKTVTLKANAFKRTNWTFAGWTTKKGGAVEYANKAKVKNLVASNGKSVTFYAVWTRNTYTVKFDANGGSGTAAGQTADCGGKTALAANVFTREGFVFAGWAVKKNGPVVYKDKAAVKDLAKSRKTATLYAVWKPEAWATGTLSGEGELGGNAATVTLTVSSAGKISGKFVLKKNKEAYSFSAARFSKYDSDAGALLAKTTLKYGTKECTVEIAVVHDWDSDGGVPAISVKYGGNPYGWGFANPDASAE